MIIAISGTRQTLSKKHKEVIFNVLKPYYLANWRVGDCKTGVDQYVTELLNIPKENIYNANWIQYKLSAGSMRNQKMLTEPEIVDLLIAFPHSTSKGTWNCITIAQRLEINIEIYWIR